MNLFPSISASRKLNGGFRLSAHYRRTISRPSIESLGTTVTYRDSLHYLTGNPSLKPTVTDAFTLGANHRGFDLSLGYRIYNDQIYWECLSDDSNPNITIDTYGNRKEKNRVFVAELSYSFNHPAFSCMTGIDCRKSSLSLPFNKDCAVLHRVAVFFYRKGRRGFAEDARASRPLRKVAGGCGSSPQDP